MPNGASGSFTSPIRMATNLASLGHCDSVNPPMPHSRCRCSSAPRRQRRLAQPPRHLHLRKASGFAPPLEEVVQLSVAFGVDGLWQLGKPVTWRQRVEWPDWWKEDRLWAREGGT